jgi:hypothetical protein
VFTHDCVSVVDDTGTMAATDDVGGGSAWQITLLLIGGLLALAAFLLILRGELRRRRGTKAIARVVAVRRSAEVDPKESEGYYQGARSYPVVQFVASNGQLHECTARNPVKKVSPGAEVEVYYTADDPLRVYIVSWRWAGAPLTLTGSFLIGTVWTAAGVGLLVTRLFG